MSDNEDQNIINGMLPKVSRHNYKKQGTNYSKNKKVGKELDLTELKLKINTLPDFVEVWHEGFCGKCGKRLTVPNSIEIGIGPDCIKKLSKQDIRDKFLDLILS
jgi:hypothetical protein